VRVDAPRPIDDLTQNYGASGEYAGTSPWSQRYTFKLGYAGSTYTDKWDSYTIENPFCPGSNTTVNGFCARNGLPSTPLALVSLPPSNNANGINATLGADLPYKSRYMGTFSYTMMRQNEPFLPFGSNPTIFNGAPNANSFATPGAPTFTNPFSSLNGQINTFLSNNVLTTQISPEWKNKLSYRYYNFDNGTPRLTLANWIVADTEQATNASSSFGPVSSLPIAYVKQNAGDELVWRPNNFWNVGFAYGYERYDWNLEAANVTNENAGKIFADWKPTADVTARASWLVAVRRFDNYDYVNNMGAIQWPGTNVAGTSVATRSVSAMREFYLNNRDRNQAKFQVDWSPFDRLTISPSAGLLYDDYQMDPGSFGIGLNYSHSWRAGVEATYLFDPTTSILLSYMFERYHQFMIGSTATGTGNPIAPGSIYMTDIVDGVHTFVAALNWTAIPSKLDFRFGYAVSVSTDTQPVTFGTGLGPSAGQYPAVTNVWQRFDASAKYRFDPDLVHRWGWKGDVYAKLLYAWERNRMGNWAIDIMNAYMFNVSSSSGYMTWMAFDNPNYDVHMVAGAVGFSW
jgi:MtrB/PioB family decaheme-associated outer membrane protein